MSYPKTLLLIGSAVIGILILPVVFLYPFNTDVNQWQWMSSVYVRYGGLPYLAAWDHDFPGIMAFHVLAITLFGNTMLGFHLVEYLTIAITVFVLYHLGRLWLTQFESLVGCLIFSLYYVYGSWDAMGQRDNFAVLPILLSAYCFVQARRSRSSGLRSLQIILGGGMVGIATTIRPTYALLAAIPVLTLFGIRNMRAIALVVAGFSVPVAVMIIPYTTIHGGIQEAYLSAVRYNSDMYPPTPTRWHWYLSELHNYRHIALWVLGAGWLVVTRTRRLRGIAPGITSSRERWFLILSFVVLLAGMLAMLTQSPHHYLPFWAGFIPVLVKTSSDILRSSRWRFAIAGCTIAVITALLFPAGLVRSYVQGRFSLDSAYHHFPGSLEEINEARSIAKYLTTHTTPDDYIQTIDATGVGWRTPRRSASNMHRIWNFLSESSTGHPMEYEDRWRAQYLGALQNYRPRYIIMGREEGRSSSSLFTSCMLRTPEICRFVTDHYRLDSLYAHHAVYVMR